MDAQRTCRGGKKIHSREHEGRIKGKIRQRIKKTKWNNKKAIMWKKVKRKAGGQKGR